LTEPDEASKFPDSLDVENNSVPTKGEFTGGMSRHYWGFLPYVLSVFKRRQLSRLLQAATAMASYILSPEVISVSQVGAKAAAWLKDEEVKTMA